MYDDQQSPTRQPQTPDQLPEAQHQSRFHHSYTAPVARFRSEQTLSRTPATSRRPRQRRGVSPEGMDTPGYEGLYGGRENNDDIALFEEALQDREDGTPALNP